MNCLRSTMLSSTVALLALSGCGDPGALVPYVHISEDNLCTTMAGNTIAGIPALLPVPPPPTTETFNTDLSSYFSVVSGNGISSDVSVKNVTLVAKSPSVTNFDFLESASASLAQAGMSPNLQPLDVIHYQKGSNAAGAGLQLVAGEGGTPLPVLVVTGSGSVDISPYLTAGPISLTLTLAGALPSVDWTLDAIFCVGGDITHTP